MDERTGKAYLTDMGSFPPTEIRKSRTGTAVVLGVQRTRVGSRLELRYADGRRDEWDVPVHPDPVAGRLDALAARRPLAVRLLADTPEECWLLGTSRRGPTRRRVSLASALALCSSGVHTVVVRAA